MAETQGKLLTAYKALEWFAAHNGDGTYAARGNTLLAAGSIAPFNRSTFNNLRDLGLIEFYDKRRVRITQAGRECLT